MSGEESAWMWSIGLITFAFGLAVGYALHFFLNPGDSRVRALEQELENLRGESETYRAQVMAHFQRTSELVQDMTQSYKAVYEHLASSSQQLCSEPVSPPQLDLPERGQLPGTRPASEADEAKRRDIPGRSETAARNAPESEEDDHYLGEAPYVPDLDLSKTDDSRTAREKPANGTV